jgi:metal-responsive CopG/Arc/MetJ family transcriptional regulator
MASRHRTQIYLDEAQIEALDARAHALGLTRSDLIRSMLDRALADKDDKPSLYAAVMQLAPDSRAAEHVAEERAAFEDEFASRQAAFRRRKTGDG